MKGLEEFTHVLNDCGLFWFLGCGCLLGIYRDGKPIPWDSDVDVETTVDEFKKAQKKLMRDLSKGSFNCQILKFNDIPVKLVARKFGVKFVLRFWNRNSKSKGWILKYPRSYLPNYLFDNKGYVELRGRKYPCPYNIESYLEHLYGTDWTVVRKGISYKDYSTSNYIAGGKITNGGAVMYKIRLTNLSGNEKSVKLYRSYSVRVIKPGRAEVFEVGSDSEFNYYKYVAKILSLKMDYKAEGASKRDSLSEDVEKGSKGVDEGQGVTSGSTDDGVTDDGSVTSERESFHRKFGSEEDLERYIEQMTEEELRNFMEYHSLKAHPNYREKGLRKQIMKNADALVG